MYVEIPCCDPDNGDSIICCLFSRVWNLHVYNDTVGLGWFGLGCGLVCNSLISRKGSA